MFTWDCVAKQTHKLYQQISYSSFRKPAYPLIFNQFQHKLIQELRYKTTYSIQ